MTVVRPADGEADSRFELTPEAQTRGPLALIALNSEIVLSPAYEKLITERAIAKALFDEREKLRVELNEKRAAEKRRLAALPPQPLDANQIWVKVKQEAHLRDPILGLRGPGVFQIDEQVRPLYYALCLYFARDERFETEEGCLQLSPGYRKNPNNPLNRLSLKKGVIVAGNIGAGKSTLMRVFEQANPAAGMSFNFASYQQIELELLEAVAKKTGAKKALSKYCKRPYLIDDLGRENLGLHEYGMPFGFVEHIIEQRYHTGTPFHQLHFTMNITTDQIRARYDARVYSRMAEMFNIIEFDVDAMDRRTNVRPSDLKQDQPEAL